MDWSDEGIFLSAKPLGEANAVAELFTLGHGRHLGLVRGGRSRRLRPLLQPGNRLRVTWRARLSEHLGGFNLELIEANAARILDDASALAAIGSLSGLARLLPERDPHPALYAAALQILEAFANPKVWPALLVRWELQLLQELGFGLDFERMRGDRDRCRARLCLAAFRPRRLARGRPTLWQQVAQAARVSSRRRRDRGGGRHHRGICTHRTLP